MVKNIFSQEVTEEIITRINSLQPHNTPLWGTMSADQMLAHCNVTYEFVFHTEKFKRPNPLMRFILKTFVKNIVVNEKPYSKNSRTAPEFVMVGQKNFEQEKIKLIENIKKSQQHGYEYFDGKENFSFGIMSGKEWNNLFYKHLDHHLSQFGL
jgi:undecaprenyl pyrophosphate synthase